jgi:predicted nucleotidyltransferase
MERVTSTIKSSMELEKVINHIKQIGKNISIKTSGLEVYLFGSILTKRHNANDVDILVVYSNEEQISIIKQEFKPLECIIPLHLIYFTYYEQIELNFISKVKAERVFKL